MGKLKKKKKKKKKGRGKREREREREREEKGKVKKEKQKKRKKGKGKGKRIKLFKFVKKRNKRPTISMNNSLIKGEGTPLKTRESSSKSVSSLLRTWC